MAFDISQITELSADRIAESEELLLAYAKQLAPDLDLTAGSAVRQFVIRMMAVLYAANEEKTERLINGSSIKKVQENPEEADTGTLDNLASNYFIERLDGTKAAGTVRIVLDRLTYTPIVSSALFTAGALTYKPTRDFAGVRSASEAVSDADRVITPYGSGQYSFLIELEAVDAGAAGNVAKDTNFSASLGQTQIVGIFSVASFDGGADTESNADFLARLTQGIATRNLGSRITASSMIRDAFPAVREVVTIGAGDPEMNRDRDNLLGISTYGHADLLIRSRLSPTYGTIAVTATLQNVETSTWVVNLPRDTASGVYRITSVVDSLGRPGVVTRILRGTDSTLVSPLDISPNLSDGGAFSRYQTLQVEFTAVEAAITKIVGDTASFTLTAFWSPDIAAISDYVLDRSRRHPCGNYLVRAVTPCEVSVELTVQRGSGDPAIDVDAVKSAVVDVVNRVSFTVGRVGSDAIAAAVKAVIGINSRVVMPIGLTGKITTRENDVYCLIPGSDGLLWVFDTNAIEAPQRPDLGVSPRCTLFFCSNASVEVTTREPDRSGV